MVLTKEVEVLLYIAIGSISRSLWELSRCTNRTFLSGPFGAPNKVHSTASDLSKLVSGPFGAPNKAHSIAFDSSKYAFLGPL